MYELAKEDCGLAPFWDLCSYSFLVDLFAEIRGELLRDKEVEKDLVE